MISPIQILTTGCGTRESTNTSRADSPVHTREDLERIVRDAAQISGPENPSSLSFDTRSRPPWHHDHLSLGEVRAGGEMRTRMGFLAEYRLWPFDEPSNRSNPNACRAATLAAEERAHV
jgi:hypothetical protein